MRKGRKAILAAVAGLGMAVAIVLCLLSPWAKGYVNRHGKELTGRTVHVEKVRLNALTGRVRMMGLQVMEEDDTTLFLNIDTIDLGVRPAKLLFHKMDVRHATVAGMRARLLQDGRRFNFTSLIEHFSANDSAQGDDASARTWDIAIGGIRLSHWQVRYADKRRGNEWEIKDLSVSAPGIYLDGERHTDAGLEMRLADGGTLVTRLDYDARSNDFDLQVSLRNMAASNAKAYLSQSMGVGEVSGTLQGDLRAKGNMGRLPSARWSGTLRLTDFAMSNTQGQEMWRARLATVAVRRANLAAMDFDVDSITIEGAASRYCRYPQGSNYGAFFSQEASPQQPAPHGLHGVDAVPPEQPRGAAAPKVRVRTFAMRHSALAFCDYSLPDTLVFPLSDIAIEARNVSLEGAERARLSATLPHGGTVAMQWQGKMRDIRDDTRLTLDLRGLQLADLSPYSVAHLAHPLTHGTAAITSQTRIRDGQIVSDNSIDMFQPQAGERRRGMEGARHIPVRAALYALTDQDGRAQIDLPVRGSMDDPQFQYGKAVWKALGNLLTKVAATPMSQIGKALGIRENGLQFIAVEPTAADFTSQQYAQLHDLARIALHDSSIVIILAQQMNADAEDNLLALAEQRNVKAREYMARQGVPQNQLIVLTQPNLSNVSKVGYKIDSELRSPDEEE